MLSRYLKPDLLIIDDMGMKQLPMRSGEYLFEIIMRRHEMRSTMMTTNRPLEDWGKLIGDVPSASAILDRFLQSAEIMKIKGKSYRLSSGKNSKGAKAPTGSSAEEESEPGKSPRLRSNIHFKRDHRRPQLAPFQAPIDTNRHWEQKTGLTSLSVSPVNCEVRMRGFEPPRPCGH